MNGGGTVQSRLTAASFERYLDGFEEVEPEDMLDARGGRVRYSVTPAGGGATLYRLGGFLQKVDPQLRYLRLFNPYARKSWSVQLSPRDGSRVRLWYFAPGTSDEIATMRKLLSRLESGELVLTKRRR